MAGSGAGTISFAAHASGVRQPAVGSATGAYGWASGAVAIPGTYGWAATAAGTRTPKGSTTGAYGWASATGEPLSPWAVGTYKWASVAVGLRTPKGSAAGFRHITAHAGGYAPNIPGPPPSPEPLPTENVGLMLVQISDALNDLGNSSSTPDPRIAPAVATLSKINSEYASNPTKSAADANTLALQIQALLASYPTANRLADALDCAQQIAGTWSGDDYV